MADMYETRRPIEYWTAQQEAALDALGFTDEWLNFNVKRRQAMVETLTERRAMFVYEGARLAASAAGAPIVPVAWEEREQPFRDQFLKVIERQCGEQRSRSPEELHGSWMQAYFAMGWVYGEKYDRENKRHPDLVPYADLGQLERDKDAVFVALCDIARQWIYDINGEISREDEWAMAAGN